MVLVNEAMQVPVVTVRVDDELRHAARVLLHHGIASAPVLDAEDRLVGMVSESDLLRGRVGRDPRAHFLPRAEAAHGPRRLVADVMSSPAVSVAVHADLADASRLLLERRIKAAPVLDGHRLVGVLARRDVLRTTTMDDEEVRRAVLDRLAREAPGQTWQVSVDDGVVTLDGPPGVEDRRIAAVLAHTVAGVVEVVG